MGISKDLWSDHIELIDKCIKFGDFTNTSLKDWFQPLISSITDDGAIPYLLETSKRFRASPLSSTISWLDSEYLLPISILDKMQDTLISLRDTKIFTDADPGNTRKMDEDQFGWSLCEGVSVWSTSLAIIALFDIHGNGAKKAISFKDSVLWLAKQCDIHSKGWAYQLSTNCLVNPIMTALALRALALSLTKPYKSYFFFTVDEERQICSSIINGIEYLKINCHQSNSKTYWSFNNNPHCAATTWVLLALKQLSETDEAFSQDCMKYYNEVLDNSLSFIISKMPNRIHKWEDEQVVYEGGAKYNKQKNYFSFSATLIPQLLILGVSPFHPRVINQIKWLINNPTDWKITKYDTSKTCSFTYAMVLATLTSWAKRVGSDFAFVLTQTPKGNKRILHYIFGYHSSNNSTTQLVLKNRIWIFLGLTIVILVVIIFGDEINTNMKLLSNQIVRIWDQTPDDRHDILINIVATILYTIFIPIGACLINLLKKLVRRR